MENKEKLTNEKENIAINITEKTKELNILINKARELGLKTKIDCFNNDINIDVLFVISSSGQEDD